MATIELVVYVYEHGNGTVSMRVANMDQVFIAPCLDFDTAYESLGFIVSEEIYHLHGPHTKWEVAALIYIQGD